MSKKRSKYLPNKEYYKLLAKFLEWTPDYYNMLWRTEFRGVTLTSKGYYGGVLRDSRGSIVRIVGLKHKKFGSLARAICWIDTHELL